MTSTDSDAETVNVVLAASRALLGIVARSMGDALEQVTLPQFRALTILTTSGPTPSRELAERLGVAPSTMSRSVERMVSHRWIERTGNPNDRRETLLNATPRAASLIGDVAARRERLLEDVVTNLPERERRAVRAAFGVFVTAAGEPQAADLNILGL